MSNQDALLKELEDRYGLDCANQARSLYEKHGDDIVIYPLGDGELLAIGWHEKAADEYNRMTNRMVEKAADKAAAMSTFALSFVVHPSREQARIIFKKLPALATKVASKAQELCGSEIEELGKA